MSIKWTTVGIVGGIIGTGFAYAWACDSTNKAIVMAQRDIAEHRTDEEKSFFEECKDLEQKYYYLEGHEEDLAICMAADSRRVYEEAKAAADAITDRELTLFNKGKAMLQKEIDTLQEACRVILQEEANRVADICKQDSAYQMLLEAKKVLVEGGKPTDEIERKLADRKKCIEEGVLGLRSDEAKQKIRTKDNALVRMANIQNEMDNIIANRSDADKKIMADYMKAADNLLDTKAARRIVIENRSDADKDLIEKYGDAELRKKSILADERTSVDPKVALGRYLKASGYSKAEVLAISMVPVVPVACAGIAYGQWVNSIIKNMEV